MLPIIQKILYKFYVFIYERENAINIEVQLEVLLNVFLGKSGAECYPSDSDTYSRCQEITI